MFDKDFFPTLRITFNDMTRGYDLQGAIILEPQGGAGHIVGYCYEDGAKEVISCELHPDLRKILATKCKVIGEDFLKIKSEDISHVDYIIMNPPFSDGARHIMHAWDIAPPGCKIISLCNIETIRNRSNSIRRKLGSIIDEFGNYEELGNCFHDAERTTLAEIGLIRLLKPGADTKHEFTGFFLEPDEPEAQSNALMPYNVVRDLVNRYVAAIKLYDQQLELAVQMNDLTSSFFFTKKPELGMSVTRCGVQVQRAEFKKEMQKEGWMFIFEKMNMQKYATKALREDINKFVEKQAHIPFTMKNIYAMLQLVISTASQRMDKSLLEVFDTLTKHYDENRHCVEGWKTNSHYLINQKFIIPYMCGVDKWHTGNKINCNYGRNFETIEDMLKAICYITGDNYDNHCNLYNHIRYQYKIYSNKKFVTTLDNPDSVERMKKEYFEEGKPFECEDSVPEYGKWFTWGPFEARAYKKGTMHFKFRSEDTWATFNQHIARIKGYPLYEGVKKSPKDREKQTNADAKRYARYGRSKPGFQQKAA